MLIVVIIEQNQFIENIDIIENKDSLVLKPGQIFIHYNNLEDPFKNYSIDTFIIFHFTTL